MESMRFAAIALVAVLLLGVGSSSTLRIDLDGDGRPDVVTLLQGKRAIEVHVQFADPSHASQTFRFVVDSAREDAICALPAHLEVERPSDTHSAKAFGFAVVDERCDSLHFYWNPKTHSVEWWRE